MEAPGWTLAKRRAARRKAKAAARARSHMTALDRALLGVVPPSTQRRGITGKEAAERTGIDPTILGGSWYRLWARGWIQRTYIKRRWKRTETGDRAAAKFL